MDKDKLAKLLKELDNDGDTVELDDGRTLRLRIESDPDTSINDFDTYGKTEPVKTRRYDHDDPRPAGFDGNAEKLWVGRHDYQVWWQPNDDGPKRGTPDFAKERQHVTDLLDNGFCGVVLELLEGEDAYGKSIVTKAASLWGIDSLEDGYDETVISELADELELIG